MGVGVGVGVGLGVGVAVGSWVGICVGVTCCVGTGAVVVVVVPVLGAALAAKANIKTKNPTTIASAGLPLRCGRSGNFCFFASVLALIRREK